MRERVPVLSGGGGEKVTLRIIAGYAHVWNGFGDAKRRGGRVATWTSGARGAGVTKERSNALS
jgi:hypothetical protein